VTRQDLVISRVFDAPIEDVWRAWHDPELIKQWWGPDRFTCPQAEIDFREGGVSLVCMRAPSEYGGKDSYSTWTYTAIELNKRIEFNHNLADSSGNAADPVSIDMPADFPQNQRQEILFSDLDGLRCELTITEYDWPAGQMMALSKLGMEQCLNKMAAALAKE
jgi:uncharacterized protein YndB with AHSA1/START domain